MSELNIWMDSFRCPDCHTASFKPEGKFVRCGHCRRIFEQSQGIWHFLPVSISHREGKEKEREGWQRRFDDEKKNGWDPPPELYLQLPYYPYPYYEEAAKYLKMISEYGKPWAGKKVLELGAAECWATRHFAENGADAAALDYDPARMIKAQIILDTLPVQFLRISGDGECLPFADNTFDCIFCCSVLHHFFDFPKAVWEIARTLKPGGFFFAIHEAFHPPHFSKEKILHIHDDTPLNLSYGINEQSFTAAYYRRVFRSAGMRLDLLNPRWDVRRERDALVVRHGAGIYHNPHYEPEMLHKASEQNNLAGRIARSLLRGKLWKIAAHPLIFPLIRFQLLNWTNKTKIIAAKKPPLTGSMITEDLWLRAIIRTKDAGNIEAIWKKGGEGITTLGERVIWGYFYASPGDVVWGDENNPELFVKIWFDRSGRLDINFFHASVPDIDVFSDYPCGNLFKSHHGEQGRTTVFQRYIRQSYENGQCHSAKQYEDGNSPIGYCPGGNPSGYAVMNGFKIGALIHTRERGPVEAAWKSGGQSTTRRGDRVNWGHIYADKAEVSWGGEENPELFVKIWSDINGRTDVNFFHASVPDIEVYSGFGGDMYEQKGTAILNKRYIRHEYQD